MGVAEEKDWFCQQILASQRGLYQLCYSILRNPEDAEDAVQEAILSAYAHLDALRQRDKWKPWLWRIAANAAYTVLRKRHPAEDVEALELPAREAPVDSATCMALWDAIQSLDSLCRPAVVLFYYEDFSVQEISRVLEVSPVAVRKRLSRGRERLKTILQEEAGF